MVNEFAGMFDLDRRHHNDENYLIMFNHIKDNQIFYRTYFRLGLDVNYKIDYFDTELAKKRFNNQFIEYHCEFFKTGITAVIKMWPNNGCKERPEDILKIIKSEYQ